MYKHILKDALECIDIDCTAHLPLKILKIKKKKSQQTMLIP